MKDKILCMTITAKGVPCKNFAKPRKGNFCNTHWKKPSQRKRKRKIFTPLERYEIIKTYGSVCYLCQKEIDLRKLWHIDHVIPFSKGGSDNIGNLRPTHIKCNELKGSKVISLSRLEKSLILRSKIRT